MKFNASNAKTMIDSMSRAIHTQSPSLTIGGTLLKKYDYLVIFEID